MEDSTVQITQYQQRITTNTNQINSLKKDIDELEILKTKIEKLNRQVKWAAEETRKRVFEIPNRMSSVIKLDLFTGILECTRGAQYNGAISELNKSKQNIQNQINECNAKIKSLKTEINNCNNQIQTIQANAEGIQ